MSSLDIHFAWRGSFTEDGKNGLAKEVKKTFENFFQGFGQNLGKVTLTVLRVGRGGDSKKLIKVCPKHEVGGRSFPGISICIFTGGTQGLFCAMTAELVSERELEGIVNGGPYRKKRTLVRQPALAAAGNVSVQESPPRAEEAVPAPEASPKEPTRTPLVVAKAPPEQREASKRFGGSHGIEEAKMDEKLAESGLPQHDIELLRVFMLELIEPYILPFFEAKEPVPPFVEIACSVISVKMRKDWVIAKPRGGFAQLYSTRISHFGYKTEHVPEGERNATWMFHVPTVSNFVSRLHKLPRKHKGEGSGKPGSGIPGQKFDTTEHVAPISGPYERFSLDDEGKRNALLERLREAFLSRQKLTSSLRDEETLISVAEGELRAIDEQMSALERKKADIQVSLASRRARVVDIKRQLEMVPLSDEDLEHFRQKFAEMQSIAQLIGIKIDN